MGQKKVIENLFFLARKFLIRTPMRRDLWDIIHLIVFFYTDSPDVWEFMLQFLVLDAFSFVCMVRYGRPTVFVRLCKFHTTIEDPVLCHATVVSSKNINEAEEFRCLRVVLYYWIVCSMYCIHIPYNNDVTHNTSRRTAAGRLFAPTYNRGVVQHGSSIVSDLHDYTNAARRSHVPCKPYCASGP